MKTIFKLTRSIQQYLRSAKESSKTSLVSGGVYRIRCSRGRVYVGTTNHNVGTLIVEYRRVCRLRKLEKMMIEDAKVLPSMLHIQRSCTKIR